VRGEISDVKDLIMWSYKTRSMTGNIQFWLMALPTLWCLTSSVIKSVIIVVTKKHVLNVIFGYVYNFKDSIIT
jgi:hypothetical protein